MHTKIILGFLKNHANISKVAFGFTTYKMQVAAKRKNVVIVDELNNLCVI
jgi:hypothetical protein